VVGRALRLSPAEVDEVWVRWRSDRAVKVLSRQMRVNPSTVRDLLHRTGGIRPAPKRRWEARLSLAEREEISRGLAAGTSLEKTASSFASIDTVPDMCHRYRLRQTVVSDVLTSKPSAITR
jgi:hypothetical protein